MPLVDEDTLHSDQRPRSAWPWVLVVVGLAGIWLLLSVIGSVANQRNREVTPTQVQQRQNAALLQQATQVASWNPAQAAALVSGVATGTLNTMEKHSYFRVGGRARVQSGDPAGGARLLEQYVGWAAVVKAKECAECHAPPTSIAPQRPSDMLASSLADEWVAALRKSGAVGARRKELSRALAKKPNDPRTLLLLSVLETAAGNDQEGSSAARRNGEKLAARLRGLE